MALKSSSGIDKDRADSRSEHSVNHGWRNHRVPGPQGPGPCRLWVGTRPIDSVSHVMRIAMHSAASSSLPAINGCAL